MVSLTSKPEDRCEDRNVPQKPHISNSSLFVNYPPSYQVIAGSETSEDPLERSSSRRLRLSTPQLIASRRPSRLRSRSDSAVYSRRQVWHKFKGRQSFDWSEVKAALPDIENSRFDFQMQQPEHILLPPYNDATSNNGDGLETYQPLPFRFMDLPEDIRKIVYGLLYKWDRNIKFDVLQRTQLLSSKVAPPSTYGPPCPVAVLQSSRDLFREGSEALYGDNTFEFTHGPSFTSFTKSQHTFGFPIDTARKFLRHVMVRRIPVREHVFLQEKFPSYFAEVVIPLRIFDSLIDYSVSLEIFKAYRRGPAVRFLSAFLEFWKNSCSTGLCGYEQFDIAPIICVRGKWRGIWLADAEAWTMCIDFVCQGYDNPKHHLPPIDLADNSHSRWVVEKFEVQGVECILFQQEEIIEDKVEQE